MMILEPIHPEDLDRSRSLYLSAFPAYERCDVKVLESHSQRDYVEWLGIYDDGFKGMAYVLFDDRILYLLYLAVVEDDRGKGIGTKVLAMLRERYPGLKMYLNIEPPDDECDNREERLRRKAFYERNGFVVSGRLETIVDAYIVMSYGAKIFPEEIFALNEHVRLDALFTNDIRIIQ